MRSKHFAALVCASLVLAGLALSKIALARGADMSGGFAFPFGPSLSAAGWQSVSFPRRRGANFSVLSKDVVGVDTDGGVGLLWRAVPGQAGRAETAQWRWRKTQGVGPTDLTRKGGDDRLLAVYFAFADPADVRAGTSLTDLMRNGRGDILMYVWGGGAKPGSVLPVPYFNGRGRTIIKREANARAGVWFDERASLQADFARAFDRAPGQLVAVAVSSDADDTRGRNVAALADLCVK